MPIHLQGSRLAFSLIVSVAMPSVAAGQATYYVRQTGNDGQSGTTPASAFRTIPRALSAAVAGSTIYVGAGTYAGRLVPPNTGTSTLPIRVLADTDGGKTGDAGPVVVTAVGQPIVEIKVVSDIHFTGFTFSGGTNSITCQNSSGIRFHGCTSRAMSGDGISITNTSGLGSVTIENCAITSGGGRGLLINQNAQVNVADSEFSSLTGPGVVLEWPNSTLNLTRTRVENVGGYGIEIDRGIAVMSSFLVRGATAGGVRVGSHSSVNATIVNGTIASVGARGILQEGAILTLRNTIIAMTPIGLDRSGGTLTHSYNQYFGCTTTYAGTTGGIGDILADPMFTSPTDLRPLLGSPAIDSGTDASSITTTDLDKKPRPINKLFDRGCYEYGSAPTLRVIRWEETSPN